VPDAKLGDIVLIHAGFAIAVLDEEEAKKIWVLLEELDNFSKTDKRVSG
jgi:hydrogenase expression/formation protein HypC